MTELHDRARRALGHWGDGKVIRLIKNRENAVFEVSVQGRRAALRLHRVGYQSPQAIASELDWCDALASLGLLVPRPLSTATGWTASVDGQTASVVSWIDGAPVGAAGTPLSGDRTGLFHQIGALIARLHNATDRWTPPAGFTRPTWDETGLLGDNPLWGRFWENPALTAAESARLQEARAAALAKLTVFRSKGADFGLIHADVLRENVLHGPDGLTLIDFDDSGWGFRLYDLATALSQSLEEPGLPELADAMLDGYRSMRPLAGADLIWWFVALRAMASCGWIASRAQPGDERLRYYAERALRCVDI